MLARQPFDLLWEREPLSVLVCAIPQPSIQPPRVAQRAPLWSTGRETGPPITFSAGKRGLNEGGRYGGQEAGREQMHGKPETRRVVLFPLSRAF